MLASRLPINKISPPSIPSKVVTRKRLFRLLDQKEHYRVTWISSMAGSGKTTLIATYLKDRNIPCLWYEIDENDADIATFFYYISMLAAETLGLKPESLPLLTPEYLSGASIFSRRFFEDLCSKISPPFYMVFDNYHEIHPDSLFHNIFKSGLSGISPDIHVVVLSRAAPPAAISSMLAKNRMRIIGPDHLLMTPSESKRLMELVTGKKFSTNKINQIHEKTKGWVAALILIAKSGHALSESSVNLDGFIPQTLFDYFATEIFNKLSMEQQEFLLKTAFLPQMTASMASVLTGRSDAKRILSYLENNHFFVEAFTGPARVYQYHPLWAEFLETIGESTLEEKEVQQLRHRSATLLQEAGEIEDAIDLFHKARSWTRLTNLILQQSEGLILQGRHKTLEQWILKLPQEILDKEPWLIYWLGVSILPFCPLEARGHLEKAFNIFERRKDMAGLCLSWASIVESIVLEWNDFTKLDPWLAWFDRHIGDHRAYPSPEIEARVAVSRIAGLTIRRPDHPDISYQIERAISVSREIGNTRIYVQAISWAMQYYVWKGDFPKVEVIHKETQGLANSQITEPAMRLSWKWLDISTRTCSMKGIDSALEDVADALTEVNKSGLHMLEPLFLMPGIFISFVVGDLSGANELLSRLQSILDLSRYHVYSVYHHFRALYYLHTGDMTQAMAEAETALRIAEETGYIFPALVCRFQVAYILFELGKIDRSRKELSRTYSSANKIGSRILQFMCLMLDARTALELKDEEGGIRLLRKAMSLGREQGFFSMAWWWYAPAIAMLCSKALAEEIEVDYVKKLVSVNRLTLGPVHCYQTEHWPWALRIRTLNRFQIIKDNNPIRFSRKAPKMPLKLLKVLIAYGGIKVHKDKIIDALWDNADGDKAHAAFSTTLNRLRNLIGLKGIIQLKDGKLSLDQNCCELDTWKFEQTLAESEGLWAQGSEKEAIPLYKKAIDIYRGHFLADEPEEPWMIPIREQLKSKFFGAILRVGKYLEKESKFEEAIRYYERALAADRIQEVFYQRLMLCYHSLGRKAEALKVYRRCEGILEKMLKTEPSRETQSLYRKILKS